MQEAMLARVPPQLLSKAHSREEQRAFLGVYYLMSV